jgi:uncharacterized DUF497 family protein
MPERDRRASLAMKYLLGVQLMKLEFDHAKRDKTLAERGLDFARASEVFDSVHLTGQDTRQAYPEDRRIISMRKANEREKALYDRYVE